MNSKIVRGNEVPAQRFGVLEVKELLPDAEAVSIALVKVSGQNRLIRNTHSDSAYYVIDGNGTFRINDEKLEVSPGDLVVIPRGSVYQDEGELTLLSVNTPPFDPNSVEEVLG